MKKIEPRPTERRPFAALARELHKRDVEAARKLREARKPNR